MRKVFGALSKAAITALAFLPVVASAQFFPPPEGSTFGPPPGGMMPSEGQMMKPPPGMMGPEGQMMGPPPGGMMGPEGQMMGPKGRTFGPGQFGAPEGMMQQGEFGQFGPSEEELGKMEQKRSEQERKMKMKGLEQMKRGLKQFSRMLERFKNKIAQLDKQGVPIPAECREGVEKAVSTVQTLLTTDDPEVLETFDFADLQSVGEVLQECGPKIEQAAQLPRIIKQIGAQVTRLEKRLKSIEARAARGKLDLSAALGPIAERVAELKASLEQLKTADDPFALLEELPEKFMEVEQQINSLEAVFQLQKALRNLNGQIVRFEQVIRRLERKGEGAEERAMLEELKGVVAELKGTKLTEETIEVLPELMGRAFELVEEIGESLEILKGPSPLFELKGVPKVLPDINVPQFEKLMLEQRANRKYFAKSGSRAAERRVRAKALASDN